MDTNLVRMELNLLGSNLWLTIEPVQGGHQGFSIERLRAVRFNTESEALRALTGAGIGHWSSFPHDGVQATVTRDQLRTVGFRGNF